MPPAAAKAARGRARHRLVDAGLGGAEQAASERHLRHVQPRPPAEKRLAHVVLRDSFGHGMEDGGPAWQVRTKT